MSDPECPPDRPQIFIDSILVFVPDLIGLNFFHALDTKPPAADVMIVPTEIESKLIR